ncbi:centromere protein P [Octodon degus]|uniref:Centromere protein P n=1 Tax=Octodon degus TaxID=10160 RepID=A0A6P6DU69_OCTDE|nr:centromere protein P [Octodon degus]
MYDSAPTGLLPDFQPVPQKKSLCCQPRSLSGSDCGHFFFIQDKYPDIVHLPEGSCSHCLGICSARHPGFELVIVWRIQIDEEGKVLPKLDLLTKIPQRALQLDKNGVIENAPLSFRTLLGVLGIEAAVESLIRLLHARNE